MNQNTLEGGGPLHSETAESSRIKSTFSRFIASVLAAVLSVAGLVALGPAAYAQTPGISVTSLHNNSPISGGEVVEPGDTFTLRVQYNDAVDHNDPVVVGLPDGVTFDDTSMEVPSGNTAIEDISLVDGSVHITFYDTAEWGETNQGVWDLNFTFDSVGETGSQEIAWSIDGETTSLDVVVRKPGDGEENVSNWLNKDASGNLYGAYVSVDGEEQNVDFTDDITDHEIQYTLNINTDGETNRNGFEISDQLSEYLVYNEDSFSAQITTWDENGWNQETNDFEFSPTIDGNSFSTTVDIPSPSELSISYTGSINPDQVDALLAAVQEDYEDMSNFPYGEFAVALDNTANFGGEERDGAVYIGSTVSEPAPAPGPNPGDAFGKSADWSQQYIEPAEDGTLEPPVDITYSFNANLSQWDGNAEEGYDNDEDFELDRNVVIRDDLPEQAAWNTSDDDFISVDGMELTEVTDFEGDAAAFAADEYVGNYAVVGQELYVNVGQSSDTDVTVSAKALISTIDGIWPWEEPNTGFMYHALSNSASFHYSDDPYNTSVEVNLIDRGDISDGVNDPDAFSKTAQSDGIEYIDIGESLTVDYQFVANGVDVTNSYIVDERDGNVFDFTDEATLAEVQENITGEYAWHIDMGAEHFDVSVNDEGYLVIQLSEAGIEVVGDDVDNRLLINLPLTTVEFDTKQTVNIENHATLYGSDDEPLYWSETTSEASSFGDEAETRKSIRDSENEAWTQNLRVEIGEDGELIQDEYVYNLAFIPHGNYSGVTISPVTDELPEEVEFLGFVADDNVDTGDNPAEGPVDIGGNLEAIYDAETRSVTVQNQEGQLLEQEDNISANVLVRIVEFEEDVPVANFFGNSSTEYTPSDGYPISIAKVNSEDDEVVISDPDSRFQVLDAEDNVVVEDAFVENGQLRVMNDDGEPTGLVVREPGTYYVEETVAPEGYELSTERIEVVVDEDGTSDQQTFPNVPTEEPPTPSIELDKNEPGDDEHAVEAGTHEFDVTFTNNGEEALENFTWEDTTESGQDAQFKQDDIEGLEDLVLEVGDSYTIRASVEVAAGETHRDTFVINADGVISGEPVEDEDPTTFEAPEDPAPAVEIIKGDGDADEGTITNDANEPDDAEQYDHLETRDVVINVENTGTEDLVDVVLTDETQSGTDIENLVWTLPNGETVDATANDDGVLTAEWDGPWAVGETITGNATLTLTAGEELHTNLASVDAAGAASGTPVEDDDPYNADPAERDYAIGDYVWIDSNNDGLQDEDEEPLEDVTVVLYDQDGEEVDRTETDERGRYFFDNLSAGDYSVQFILTDEQAATYKFTDALAGDVEADSDAGNEGRSGDITLGEDNGFLTADDDYEFFDVTASEGIDPTWDAGVVLLDPSVAIIKGDAGVDSDSENPLLVNDANTADDAEQYGHLESRDVVINVHNTGNEDLTDVVLTDETQSGADIESLVWTLPNGDTVEATANDDGVLTAEWDGPWAVGETITGNATLTLTAGDELHTNLASVDAVGAASGTPVKDDDPYNADPAERDYAIGDYVWIDSDNDGLQGDDEEPLENVTVVLYDGEGKPIADTTTDERGRYFFDNLPAGDYQVGFELTDEQAATYKFTDALAGDVEADSDAGSEGRSAVFTLGQDNEFLSSDDDYEYFDITASEGIDPTWDAGVVLLDPSVEIIKGDGDADEGTITNDANTEDDAVAYEDGETRDIVITVRNTGNEDLTDVVLTDETQSGADIENLVWTLPNGDIVEAILNDDGVLTVEWDGTWEVGDTITGVATLTLTEGEELHTNLASVDAVGAASGTPVEDEDPYNGTPPEVVEETPPPTETPDPEDPKDPAPDQDPKDPAPEQDPEDDTQADKEGELSSTGANFALTAAAIGLLLLVVGALLYARHRKGSEV